MKTRNLFIRIFGVGFMLALLTGCATTYNKQSDSVVGINVPDRLKGGWTYSIDDSIKNARRNNFKPTSHICSAHTFNLDASATLASALRKGMQEFLESGSETNTAAGVKHVAFKLDSYQPRFNCSVGMAEPHCNGTAEVVISVLVLMNGERKSFSVSTERSADAAGGNLCVNALDAPADATRKAAKDVVERAMERLLTVAK